MLFRIACSSLLLAATFTAACGSDDTPPGSDPDAAPAEVDAAPLSPSCMEAADHSDLEWLQANVFDSCSAFGVCHKGAAMSAGGLNLESGNTQDAMSGVTSTLFSDWTLVVPGDPANSYLMVILGAEDGPLKDGVGTMPYNNPLLCQPKLDAINRWITSL